MGLTINNGATLNVGSESGNGTLMVQGDTVVNGTLIVTGNNSKRKGTQIIGGENWSNASADVKYNLVANAGSNVTVNDATLSYATITMTDGNLTLSGSGSTAGKSANIFAYGIYDYQPGNAGSSNATNKFDSADVNLSGMTVKMQQNADIGAHDAINITGSTITASSETDTGVFKIYANTRGDGTGVTLTDSSLIVESGKLVVKSSAENGQIDLINTTVTTKKGAKIDLTAPVVDITTGTEVINNGEMTLGQEGGRVNLSGGSIISKENADNIWALSNIYMTDGTISMNTKGHGLLGFTSLEPDSTVAGSLYATGGDISVSDSQIQMANITLGGDVNVVLGGSGSKSQWRESAQIGTVLNAIDDTSGGVLTIQDNASITMNANSLLYGREVNINGGTITFNGTGLADADGGSEAGDKEQALSNDSSYIRAYGTNGGAINVNGGELIIGTANKAALYAKTINFNGGTIKNSGVLELSHDRSWSTASGANFKTNVTVTNTVFSGNGTLEAASGATINFAGNNTEFNGFLKAKDTDTSVNVTGKLTFNGDNSSGTLVDMHLGKYLNNTGTLVINNTQNTIGLIYTAESNFDLASGTDVGVFKGLSSGSNGNLYLDLNAFNIGEVTAERLAELKESLESKLVEGGSYNGNIYLEGVTVALASGTITEDNTASWEAVEDILSTGTTPENLKSTQIDVTNPVSQIAGGVGSVNLSGAGSTNVNMATGETGLTLSGYADDGVNPHNALITVESADGTQTVGGASLKAGADLDVNNNNLNGETAVIGSIVVDTGTTGLDNAGTMTVTGSTKVVKTGTNVTAADTATDLGDIGAANAMVTTFSNQSSLEAKDVYAQTTQTSAGSYTKVNSITTRNLSGEGSIETKTLTVNKAADGSGFDAKADYDGDLKVDDAVFNTTTTLNGDNTFNKASFNENTTLAQGYSDIGNLSLAADKTLKVVGNATVSADVLTVAGANSAIEVGQVDAAFVGDENANTSGYLFAGRVDLNGGTIIVDPSFDQNAAVAIVGGLGTDTDINDDAGVLNGRGVALQNSILAIGVDATDGQTEEALKQEVLSTFAQYLEDDGSLQQNGPVGAITYVAKKLTVGTGSKIIVDASHSSTTYENTLKDDATVLANDIYLGQNAALALDKEAVTGDKAAITFNKSGATIHNSDGKIVLVGTGFHAGSELNLFQDGDQDGITLSGDQLSVETLNGLLVANYNNGETIGTVTLSLNKDAVDDYFTDTSAPVRNTLISYVARDNNWANQGKDGYEADTLHGDHLAYKDASAAADYEATLKNDFIKVPVYEGKNTTPVGYDYYEAAYNDFLEAVVSDPSRSGRAADTVARLGAFGGVAQSAMAAGSTTYEAISGRMGMGATDTNITVADNTQGAAIWLTPVYKNNESDGFDAGGVDYGVDMDLYGVALGADYTLANGLHFGALFNVGSGDADGQGDGSNVSNDFDYYGFGAYVGYTYGAFSVLGDLSYTVVDNDVEGTTGVAGYEKVSTSLDSANFSIGVTAQYEFVTGSGFKTVPHIGLRYSDIDIDDYDVADIASYDADSLSIFSIPVGVTFSKDFTSESWTIKPSLDISLTGNFGDDSADGTVNWAGVSNLKTDVSNEVIDNFTYGATLGVAAQSGNFGFGLGLNYTGSSNTDEFGVTANARFVF